MQIDRQIALISCIFLLMILSISPAIAVNLTAEVLTDKGVQEARQQKYDDAIISYDQALQIDPDYALAWYNRGLCLVFLGRNDEALTSLDKALLTTDLQNPDKNSEKYLAGQVWFNRGAVLDNLGRYEESIASYDEALAIDMRDAAAWNNRGNSLVELGRYDEALASIDTALKITEQTTDPIHIIAQKNHERVLAEQKNATIPQQQIQSTPLPTESLQPKRTTLQPTASLQPTQKAPLVYAPISALVLIAGLYLLRRL